MFTIQTLNKISATGLSVLNPDLYTCADAPEAPDAVIVRSASMHDMSIPQSVLSIARAGAGYNNIPVEACTEQGICVFNTPGANAGAVKELTICALLLASRKIAAGAKWCLSLAGDADAAKKIEKGKSAFAGPEIAGKTLGVIGLGAIGRMVAEAAQALGMQIIGFDPFLKNSDFETVSDINEIFKRSDYITMHAPLTEDTKNTINADTLALCKDGVRIVNFARGGLVNTADLLAALASGKCAAYVTDFPAPEMIGVDGVTALPHLGASTPESEENCAVMASRQTADYLENGNVTNSVNLPRLRKDGKSARVTVITAGDHAEELARLLNTTDYVSAVRGSVGYVIADEAAANAGRLADLDYVIRYRVLD